MDNYWIGYCCGFITSFAVVALINLVTIDWIWKKLMKDLSHD